MERENPHAGDRMQGLRSKEGALNRELAYSAATALFLFLVFLGNVNAFDFTGYKDCTACHNGTATTGAAIVNVTAMNISIHRDLNNDTSLTLPAGAPNVTKACWACHGNGLEPTGDTRNAHDTWVALKNPWNCSDCHTNKTNGYNTTSGLGNYSAPLIVQHINGTDSVFYSRPTVNASINTSVQCWSCHNESVRYANDSLQSAAPRFENNTDRSNVSHYGTNTTLKPGGYNSNNCTACHMNTSGSTQWYLQQREYVNKTIRHSDNNATFCDKCHNSTNALNLHDENIFYPFYTHYTYDWENDGIQDNGNPTGQPWKFEACFACHGDTTGGGARRTCEDCHLNGSIGPFDNSGTDFNLRTDWNESIPLVWEHIFINATYNDTTASMAYVNGTIDVEVSTGNVSSLVPTSPGNRLSASTCIGWNNNTAGGACHGVPSTNTSDGYYAFSNKSGDINITTREYFPYLYNAPVDWLPDTGNCTYCHLGNASVRRQWGNISVLSTLTSKRIHTSADNASNNQCLACHEENGTKPTNFHARSVNNGTGGPDCAGCHDVGKASGVPDVDIAAMNLTSSSIHNNLSGKNTNPNTTILTDEVDKACWACRLPHEQDRRLRRVNGPWQLLGPHHSPAHKRH
jgi:hypothetical protein